MGTKNLTYTDDSKDITGGGAPISKGVAVTKTNRLPTDDTNTLEIADLLISVAYCLEVLTNEVKLLNTRFEDAYQTGIEPNDVDDDL